MPQKASSSNKFDTRVTATLSPLAHQRLMRLVQLLGSVPGTEVRQPLEDWIFSDDFDEKLAQAEKEHARQNGGVDD